MDWSFQLYSARNTEIGEALKIISDVGFTSVEAYGDNFVDADGFRAVSYTHLTLPTIYSV